MSRKSMVLGLAVVLAVAVAIPVVAQERAVTPKLQKISQRALKKAGTALRTSRAAAWHAQVARSEAQAAGQGADQAAAAARQAGSAASGAQASVDSTRLRTAVAGGSASTESEDFVALAGGPTLQVTVPASGLIEVWAQATIDGEGAVALFEDGKQVPGQASLCGPGAGALFSLETPSGEPLAVGTPAAFGTGICGSLGAPGPVLFQTTPGIHTYELRYASCGCAGPTASVAFSERSLFVGPRL
jgi:hypothetical protein